MSDDFNTPGDDDFDSAGSIGEVWRNNPLLKVGAVVIGLAVIVGGLIMFTGEEDKLPPSAIRAGNIVSDTPGQDVDPAMEEALKEKNKQFAENAVRTGTSAIPVPIGGAREPIKLPTEEGGGDEDPLEKWRKAAEARKKKDETPVTSAAPVSLPPPPPPPAPDPEGVAELAQLMAEQMAQIIGGMTPKASALLTITDPSYIEDIIKEKAAEAATVLGADGAAAVDGAIEGASSGGTAEKDVKLVIPAGTVVYAQLLTEANSDVPAPILAAVLSGPLSGGRAIGGFEVAEDHLILRFNTIVKGEDHYSVDTVALDTNTTLAGLATDIDRHYFSRVIIPAAAEFISGFGEAYADSGNTTVSVSGDTVVETEADLDIQQELAKGFQSAADSVSEAIEEDFGDRPTTIRVETGTPMGLLFVQRVTTESVDPL